MMDFNRTSTSDSNLSSDSLQSGGKASVRSRPRPEYGSKTSVSHLPSLPNRVSQEASDSSHIYPSEVPSNPGSRDTYVEFDLSSKNNNEVEDNYKITEKVIGGKADEVSSEIIEREDNRRLLEDVAGSPNPENEDDFFNMKTSNWKSMKTITDVDYYDEKGNLEFEPDKRFDSMENPTGSRGYTKIDSEEQVAKYAELDKKTDFLFQARKSSKSHEKTYETLTDDLDSEYEDDENLDSKEAMQTTKSMLSDSQKFAYVGIAKLIMVEMATELANMRQYSSNKVAKRLSLSQKNFANWTMYILTKIYDHLDLSNEEQIMIENLSRHGLEVSDLVDSLLEKASLPMIEEYSDLPNFDLRWVIICDMFLLLLSDGYYDSRSRSLLMQFSGYIGVSNLEIYQFERRLLESLELETNQKSIDNKDDKFNDRLFIDKRIKRNRKKRLAYVGLATLGGGLAIGLSAGLLAPVIGAGVAAGLTTVGIGGTSGFLAGIGGSAIITTGGVAVGAKVGSKAGARRLGDVHTFEFKPLYNNRRANLILTVSGWMIGQADDIRLPFSTVDPVMGDMFSLLWEPEMLRSMGQTIGILASEALTSSIQQILGATFLSTLMSAIQLPVALSKLSYLLDNPWNVSLDRAWKAGKIMADVLISGNMGVRPITLVGFSLGARVIYSCLIELARRGGYGLIENVVILGTPITVKKDQLALARSVVSGKFTNGYSKKDWVLGYLFRATGGGLLTVAGLSPIESCNIDNIDCTEWVEGHMSYRKAIPKILKAINWEVLSDEFAEIEEPDPEENEKTRKLVSEFDEARLKMMKEMENKSEEKKTWKDWFRPKPREWWDTVGEGELSQKEGQNRKNTEEYEVEERYDRRSEDLETSDNHTQPIFDLQALAEEVNQIETLATEDKETLNKIKNNVDSEDKGGIKLNEDMEDTEGDETFVGNFGKKIFSKPKA
ncbi:uncharacterized protein PRCAT00004590001 [Priceomyces carsonii]|uniref:uncharacterized protein n=1 Tax=Priceomyces carsonii TaxID=28549 RepID=UPI002ED7979C|nr:unnamed protein product [Priceomyces carsonii]